jgi:hypothetical protein
VDYRLAVKFEAIQFLVSLRKIEQNRIMWWLERLRDSPFTTGQALVVDSTGRYIQVGNVALYRVFHWTDHAVKTVQVIKIEWNS